MRKRARLVYWNTGFGILRDAALIEAALQDEGYTVASTVSRQRSDKRERAMKFLTQVPRLAAPDHLQCHLEQIHREQFLFARRNVVFPNPEFTHPAVFARLPRLTKIACKTRHALALMEPLGPAEYVGFTSLDRMDPRFEKDYNAYLHLAGASHLKGTLRLLREWATHPEWPLLTVVWAPVDAFNRPRAAPGITAANIRLIAAKLSNDEVVELQNRCGVHLCTSRTEGFGHYIVEALSCGAVVVTTDAAPMNELVSPDYGFPIACSASGQHFMNTLYDFEPAALERAMARLVSLPTTEKAAMGARARAWYEANDRAFRARIRAFFRSLC